MPSAVIRTFAYDAASQTLAVTFTSGRRYRYHAVPAETYAAMKSAFAKGEFFNKRIRDRFRYTAEDGSEA